MKKALIIGSTVVDVIVNLVDSLPTTGEDVHVRSQHMSLGGCAYNVSDSVRSEERRVGKECRSRWSPYH